jgi:ribosome-associated protein
MEGTSRDNAVAIARMLEEHRAEEVVVLDVAEMAGWTDFFVIATVASGTHRRGLLRQVSEFLEARRIEPLNKRRHPEDEEGWVLIDCGNLVIHLMDAERRAFYELEKLWFRSERVYSPNSSASRSSSVS